MVPTMTFAEEKNPDYQTVAFDLSNPNAQSQTIIVDGKEVTISMSEELSPKTRANENVPFGTFSRRFSHTDSVTTMSALYTGVVNPYASSVTSVSGGVFNSYIGTYIRERYSTGTYLDINTGCGKYTVDYSIYTGGTFTISLFVWIQTSTYGATAYTTFMTS